MWRLFNLKQPNTHHGWYPIDQVSGLRAIHWGRVGGVNTLTSKAKIPHRMGPWEPPERLASAGWLAHKNTNIVTRDLLATASRVSRLSCSHVYYNLLSLHSNLASPLDVTATMSSSEEENFDIDVSDDESEEDYAPVVKKKVTTVRFGILATWVGRLTASLIQDTEERCKGYYEAGCQETRSKA